MVAAAVIGSAVVGGVASSVASSKASKAQQQASSDSNATQLAIFNQQREDQTPWREAGAGSLKQLVAGTAGDNAEFNQYFGAKDLSQDPGYQFRMAEAQKALERSAASRGNLLGGATAKALTRYSQGIASDEYSNAYNRWNNDRTQKFNRLSALAGVGQTANSQIAQAGQNYANNVSQNQLAAGNAKAAGYTAMGSNISNLASGIGTYYATRSLNNVVG